MIPTSQAVARTKWVRAWKWLAWSKEPTGHSVTASPASCSSRPSVHYSLPSFLQMTQPSRDFINKCWKHWTNQGLLPALNIGEEEAFNMGAEPTHIINKIRFYLLKVSPIPKRLLTITQQSLPLLFMTRGPSPAPFLIRAMSKSEESLSPSLPSKLCQMINNNTYQVCL